MKILISQQAQKRLLSLPQNLQETAKKALEIMQAERFPKIRALLQSDISAEKGRFVREHGGLEFVYEFFEEHGDQTILIVSILQRDQRKSSR